MDPSQSSQTTVLRLAEYWPYLVTVLSDRIARRTSKIVKDQAGLNLSQWRVMAAIGDTPGRTSREVVQVTPMDKGIVSRATKALLHQGLVYRAASQEDGRVSYLYLTDKGTEVYNRLIPEVEGVLLRAGEVLSEADQTHMSTLLAALMDVLPDLRES